MAALPIRLIVNADDYGYFPCVSKGILKAAALGTVTATGILVNGPDLEAQIGWLAGHERLDLGVHLNLTSRKPLTAAMAEKLERWGGSFPGVFAMTGEILSGRIKEGDTAVVDVDENAQVVVSQSRTSRELLPQGAES